MYERKGDNVWIWKRWILSGIRGHELEERYCVAGCIGYILCCTTVLCRCDELAGCDQVRDQARRVDGDCGVWWARTSRYVVVLFYMDTSDAAIGVQYATKLGYKVIGIDVVDAQLEEAKAGGALHTFNSMKDKDYIQKIREITDGGCHAAVNYTASAPAYDATPPLLRAGGIMMVVGIPSKGMSEILEKT